MLDFQKLVGTHATCAAAVAACVYARQSKRYRRRRRTMTMTSHEGQQKIFQRGSLLGGGGGEFLAKSELQ